MPNRLPFTYLLISVPLLMAASAAQQFHDGTRLHLPRQLAGKPIASDLDGDDSLDVVAASNTVTLLRGAGHGVFTDWPPAAPGNPRR